VTGPLPSVAAFDEPEEPEAPVRPTRPGTVELAAAMLIVGGVLGAISALASSTTAPAGLEALPLLTLSLTLLQVAVGLLIRLGRFWLLAVNYVAVLAFLDLLAAGISPLALMLGLSEALAVVILLVRKPWFDAMARWRSAQPLTPPTARPPTR
jgi:hypothetical protein